MQLVQVLIAALLSSHADGASKVSIGEIEDRLRSLSGNATRVIGESKQNVLAAGVVGGALLVAGAYLHGRRRGRRRATVLEIRRV